MAQDSPLEMLAAFGRRAGPYRERAYPAQDDAVRDKAQYQTWVCGRRAGKTLGLLRLVLETAAFSERGRSGDDAIVAYVAPTKVQAKRLIWGRMQSFTAAHEIAAEYNHTESICRLEQSQIWIMGADTDRDVDRLRGFPFRLVVVDEAQSVTADLEYLVEDVISPALADYSGKLVLVGTPNASCTGYLHDISTSSSGTWSRHHWTVLDNPMFPAWHGKGNWQELAREYLRLIREQHGWSEDDPTYLREWLGVWARDEMAVVYAYDRERNSYDALPGGHKWNHVIGVDLGMDDSFAVVVWAFAEDHLNVYCVDEYSSSGLTVSAWADIIRQKIDRWNPLRVVADTGGLGKAIVAEMSSRYALPIHPAEKQHKLSYIELLNNDLRTGRVKVRADSRLARSWQALQWDDTRRVEDPRTPNDVPDAALYGYREALHWLSREKPIVIDTPEARAASAEEKMLQQRLKKKR